MNLIQRFKKSAQNATTVTLIPTTAADPQALPDSQKLTQIVVTAAAVQADLWGASGDACEFWITVERTQS